MRTKLYFIAGTFVFGSILFPACSSRRIEKDMSTSESADPVIMQGRLIFKNKCQPCHPNGEAGVGTEINTIRVPKFLLKARVRSRAFLLWTGRMPQFGKHEISPKELNSLVAFIKVMQRNERSSKEDHK
jgi:hypothetical protein